jgi:hypothetical protein
MKLLKNSITILLLSSLFILTAHAETDVTAKMVNANDNISGLDKALADAKKDSTITVEFPAVIPKTKQSYFASYDTNSKQYGFSYMINVDSTADCHGVKYCNVGIVSAKENAEIDKMKNRSNKVITTKVMLADGMDAYYTPGHAMGDYFPASIQWMDNKVLYMISWNIDSKAAKDSKALLITMANSAKHPGSG